VGPAGLTGEWAVRPWDARAAVPELGREDVHLWLVELDVEADEHARLRSMLTPPERARADAYRLPLHGSRYAVGRGRLREMLAAYGDHDPARIELAEGPSGKPELATPPRGGLHFNLAHCEGLALCAVSLLDVGVDLELVDRPRRPRWAAVAARFFHDDELRLLRGASGDAGWTEFLRLWTLKEACLKAAGFGLVLDPRSFSVAEIVSGRAESANVAGRDWRCVELRPAAGALAALAAARDSEPSPARRSRS
jgi:4'-phosphopantetheinyl transferase